MEMARSLINEMRIKRKVSQYRLAKELGVHYANIKRVLAPDYDPKLSVLARCAKALRCKIRDLYRE